jgi:tetratricopeptide (TPR) repeat protein
MKPSTVPRVKIFTGSAIAGALLIISIIMLQFASETTLPTGISGAATSPKAEAQYQHYRNAAEYVSQGNRLMQQVRTTQADDYYRRAEAAYLQALAIDPANAAAMTGLAWVHGGRHEFEESIHWARKAVRRSPDSAGAYGLWGDALVEMGDYDGAFVQYQQMLDLRPDLASYSRSAHLLFLTGATEDALMLMDKAISAGSPYAENLAWCRAQLALMLYRQGAYKRAATLLTSALKQTPDNYHLLTAMAQVQTALQNYREAIDCYEAATARVPEPAMIVALGELYLLTGRRTAAERRFAWAEAIWRLREDGGWQPDIHRARFYADHDRNLVQALTEAERLYRNRRNIAVADTLAWCYYKNGRDEEARTMILQALRLETPDARMLYHAGMIHERLGERSEARRYLRQALALSPNFDPRLAKLAAHTLAQLTQSNKGG